MIKTIFRNILKTILYLCGIIFLTVFFYIAMTVLLDPLNLFLQKKIEFIYGLF